MKISVIGGVYREYCTHPFWDEIYGSAGRASSALAGLDIDVDLYTCLNNVNYRKFLEDHSAFKKINVINHESDIDISFYYENDSFSPKFNNLKSKKEIQIKNQLDNVIYYGSLEADFNFNSTKLVFDPQSPDAVDLNNIKKFNSKEKCIILNKHEVCKILQIDETDYSKDRKSSCKKVLSIINFDLIIVKEGPNGGYLFNKENNLYFTAYKTNNVWKIGSGDVFTAYFGYFWMIENKTATESTKLASLATAFYCDKIAFPTVDQVIESTYKPVEYKDLASKKVYLAGPFFDFSQKIIISKFREIFISFGIQVFSPMHDVGIGKNLNIAQKDIEGLTDSQIVFAWLDGLDTGTIFEIGYARAKDIPVVILTNTVSEEDLLMFRGTGCHVFNNITSAIYNTVWIL